MSGANKLFWNCVCYVEIENIDGSYTKYEGLDIRFDVQTTGSTYSRFTVGICNLSRDRINDLITWPKPDSYKNPRHIKVYAGYEDGGANLIAYGGIFSAIPTPPPDVWLNIEANQFLENRAPIEGEKESKQESFDDIFARVCKICGMQNGGTDGVTTVDRKRKYDYSYTGSKENLPMNFSRAFNVVTQVKGETLICLDRDGQYKEPKNPHPIDFEHGLLAVGALEYNKAAVTTRLNDVYTLFDWAYLTSERIPQASDYYWITAVRHTGHLRGNEWQTTVTMIRRQKQGGS